VAERDLVSLHGRHHYLHLGLWRFVAFSLSLDVQFGLEVRVVVIQLVAEKFCIVAFLHFYWTSPSLQLGSQTQTRNKHYPPGWWPRRHTYRGEACSRPHVSHPETTTHIVPFNDIRSAVFPI
jgi:hypothetical protein